LAFGNIKQILDAGARTVHCNTHYLAPFVEEEIAAAVRAAGFPADAVRFWREDPLLETGGGVARIFQLLAAEEGWTVPRDALVVSGDIHGEIPLKSMLERWGRREPSEVALLTSREPEKGRTDGTWIDREGEHVLGFGQDLSSDEAQLRGALVRNFSGNQLVAGATLLGASTAKASIIQIYRTALRAGLRIAHVEHPAHCAWFNVGTYAEYDACLKNIENSNAPDYADQPSPTHCLVIASPRKNSGEGVLTLPGSPALSLFLSPWPFTHRRLGSLRTLPSFPGGEGLDARLVTRLLTLDFSLLAPSTGCTFGRLAVGSPSSDPALIPSPSLVFRVGAPSRWELSQPLLVPLEFLDSPEPCPPGEVGGLYAASRTFFLFTPG
jgi:hypothetical protein